MSTPNVGVQQTATMLLPAVSAHSCVRYDLFDIHKLRFYTARKFGLFEVRLYYDYGEEGVHPFRIQAPLMHVRHGLHTTSSKDNDDCIEMFSTCMSLASKEPFFVEETYDDETKERTMSFIGGFEATQAIRFLETMQAIGKECAVYMRQKYPVYTFFPNSSALVTSESILDKPASVVASLNVHGDSLTTPTKLVGPLHEELDYLDLENLKMDVECILSVPFFWYHKSELSVIVNTDFLIVRKFYPKLKHMYASDTDESESEYEYEDED